jgi:hypothetical protein
MTVEQGKAWYMGELPLLVMIVYRRDVRLRSITAATL